MSGLLTALMKFFTKPEAAFSGIPQTVLSSSTPSSSRIIPNFRSSLHRRIPAILTGAFLHFIIGADSRWWGNNPKEKRQEEIDILAYRKDSALFCECKWTNALVDIDVLDDLTAQSDLFPYTNKWFWLFAKVGFTDRLTIEAEKRSNVRLIHFEDMI